MTDTISNLAARQLMCDVIYSTIKTAMGEVSAFVEDPADNRARREAIQDARDYSKYVKGKYAQYVQH